MTGSPVTTLTIAFHETSTLKAILDTSSFPCAFEVEDSITKEFNRTYISSNFLQICRIIDIHRRRKTFEAARPHLEGAGRKFFYFNLIIITIIFHTTVIATIITHYPFGPETTISILSCFEPTTM
jgi:hypothetical protein